MAMATSPGESSHHPNALDIVGHDMKELIAGVTELQHYGIDADVIAFPKIVAVGDQSAGKSSIIHAISDIAVPRDSGTCTRCVLHIGLREEPDAAWQCEVSLQRQYDFVPECPPKDRQALYPWSALEPAESEHFATVKDKSQLEMIIRQAQLALLNPMRNTKEFHHGLDESDVQVQFSPNVISLDIVGPGLMNLSFYDLPGVISQAADGGKETVRLIKSLVRRYISQVNTLILLCIPMETDIDTSMASSLVDDAGARDRTIGVLTKPDRLQSGDRVDIWNDVLRGEKFQMGHGYFVVKQPSQNELKKGMDHAKARIAEEAFFNGNAKWISRFLKPAGGAPPVWHDYLKSRLGTFNLQNALSQKLARLTHGSLPSLEDSLHKEIENKEFELSKFPEPPPNALHVVNRLIFDYAQDVKVMIEGSEPNDFTAAWKAMRKEFYTALVVDQLPKLLITAPKVAERESPAPQTTMTPKQKGKRIYDAIPLSDDDVPATPMTTPSKKAKMHQTSGSHIKSEAAAFNAPISQPVEPTTMYKCFQLPEIRSRVEAYSDSLPGVVPPKAVDRLITDALQNWEKPLEELQSSLADILQKSLASTLASKTKQWETTALFKELKAAITAFTCGLLAYLRKILDRARRIELKKPITMDESGINRILKEQVAYLEAKREDARIRQKAAELGEEVPSDRLRKQIAESLGQDPYQGELTVMARIRAYYSIASNRFVDQVIQAVEAELFMSCRDDLSQRLLHDLKIEETDGHLHANRLLADDPKREQRRAQLKKELKRMGQALEKVRQLNSRFEARDEGSVDTD